MPGLYDDSLTSPTATPGLWDWLQHPLNSYGQWAAASSASPGMRLNGAPPNVGAFTPAGQPAALPTQAPPQDPATNPFQSFAGQGQFTQALAQAAPAQPVAPPQGAAPSAQQSGWQSPDGWDLVGNARNNPLNLRFAGQNGATNTNGFAAFPDANAGLAATQNQFGLYAKRGINTLRGLISTWAPPTENNTGAYIGTVSSMTGLDPDAQIDLNDPATQKKVMAAMSRVENGPTPGQTPPHPGATPQPGMPETTTLTADAQPVPQQGAQQSPPVDPVAAAQAKAAADLANYKPTPDPYPNAGMLPQGSNLIALASGLLSGPTLGVGLGKGLQNMLSVDAANRQGQMQMNQLNRQQNQQMMELQRLGIMTGFNGVKLGQAQQGLGIRQQTADNGTTRANVAVANSDPNHAGAVAGAKLASGNAQKDIEAVQNSRMSDEQAAQDSAQAQQQILQHPELMGTTLAARASRVLAETGIAGDPNALSALQKMTADARNTYLTGLTGGHVGGIRSNAELQNLSKAVADVNTNPAAAQWIIKMQQNQINARQGWREELAQRQQEDPASVQGQNYFRQKDQFMKDWLQRNPLPDYAPSSQGAAAAPGTTASGDTKGASATTSTGISYHIN